MVYLRNNLPKIKDSSYVINLDAHKLIETHCIALYVKSNFGVKHTSKELKKFIGNKNVTTNIYRI